MNTLNKASIETELREEIANLKAKLADANDEIRELKDEIEYLEGEIREIDDFSDEEVRREFLVREMIDPVDREWRLLAEMIAANEADKALDLVAELSKGAVSPAVAKMTASFHLQGGLF